jgi:hypothetical protein
MENVDSSVFVIFRATVYFTVTDKKYSMNRYFQWKFTNMKKNGESQSTDSVDFFVDINLT